MSQQNLQAVKAIYNAYNQQDLDGLATSFAESFQRFEPEDSLYSSGSPYVGAAGLIEGVYKPRSRDFQNWRTDIEQLFDAGDTVVATGRYRARNKTTSKELATQFCHLIHFDRNGKVDRVQAFTDTLKEAEVAGLVQTIVKPKMPERAM